MKLDKKLITLPLILFRADEQRDRRLESPRTSHQGKLRERLHLTRSRRFTKTVLY